MNKNFKPGAQGGFTLIELIVVIVILGILAATALPKFANLSGDARFAALNAAKGAMASASAIVHGQILVNPASANSGSVTVENTSIPVSNGYPTNAGILTAASIVAADYTSYTTTGTNVPTIPTNGMVLVPTSIAGTTAALGCYVSYVPAQPASGSGTTAVAATAPVLNIVGSASACQ